MFRGSSAIPGPSSSGRPRSVLPNTSRARVPAAWPTCMPKTAPPSWRIICPPRSAPWVFSATNASGAWVRSAATSASATDAATGSARERQRPMVCSTHSERLQARTAPPPAGRSVAASSHTSAALTAAATSRWSDVLTDGSPSETATWRARSCATSQLTGSSPEESSTRLIWPSTWLRASGSLATPAAAAMASRSRGVPSAPTNPMALRSGIPPRADRSRSTASASGPSIARSNASQGPSARGSSLRGSSSSRGSSLRGPIRVRSRRSPPAAARTPGPRGPAARMLDDVRVTDPFGPLPGPPADEPIADEPPLLTPRAVTQAVATVATAILLAGTMAMVGVPYVVDSPGPTLDTLGEYHDAKLIVVDGAPTYPSTGQLRLTTVSVLGGPGSRVSLIRVLEGWWDPSSAVRPVEDVVPPDQTPEEIAASNQAAMITSQEQATVAALEELGYQVPTTLGIGDTLEGTGAYGVLKSGDVMVALDGEPLSGFSELSRLMDAVEPGADVTVTVERDGSRQDLVVTTVDDGTGRALLGVLVDAKFDLPVDVKIQIENIGGPSAGLMFSLGIINTLTEPDETGGQHIAGTGTMDRPPRSGPSCR